MLQTEQELTVARIHELLAPALNVCRAIELDVQQHPGCPYREAAQKGTTGILRLMDLIRSTDNGPGKTA